MARDPYDCWTCRRPFYVVYDEIQGEPAELAPISCPHCECVNCVSVGRKAASSVDYVAIVETRDRYDCLACRRAFAVVYDSQPGEPGQVTAVRCPHCAWTNYASIGRSAMARMDGWFHVEKAVNGRGR